MTEQQIIALGIGTLLTFFLFCIFFPSWNLTTKPETKRSSPKNSILVVHSTPVDCINRDRKCQICNLDRCGKDAVGCPLI